MKTRIFREGDKGSALCENCANKVITTYQRREVPLSDGSDTVKDVLVGVCDSCDEVVSMPYQSVPRVNKVIAKRRKPLEARVPAHLKDMLLLVNRELNQDEGFEQYVIQYYLREWASKGAPRSRIQRYYRNRLFHGAANSRLSFRLRGADQAIEEIRREVEELRSTTELLKAVTFAAYDDVIEKSTSRARTALEIIAAAHG